MEIKNRELHRVEGKYLVTKRSPHKKSFPNKWTVPGGGMEVEDYINSPVSTKAGHWYYAIEKTLRREVKEEVNLEISKPKYLLDLAFVAPDGTPSIVLSYYADYVSGEIKLDGDSTEYKWITAEEAKSIDLIEGIDEEIEMADKIIKNKK
jgi:8-oxo-dGTP pyrophosphatase MutT (NUDIX family)